MKFLIEFNNKLIKKMFFYKTFSEETFNYKKFSSKKILINKIKLSGHFKKKVIYKKKDILKKSIVLKLLTNSKSHNVFLKKKKLNLKKNTIINIENYIDEIHLDQFLINWFFKFNLFFKENEIESINGPKSIKKNLDSFKLLRLLNSRIINSNLFNFEVSLKKEFYFNTSSDIFFSNYEC